jgi:hypothetical protein
MVLKEAKEQSDSPRTEPVEFRSGESHPELISVSNCTRGRLIIAFF